MAEKDPVEGGGGTVGRPQVSGKKLLSVCAAPSTQAPHTIVQRLRARRCTVECGASVLGAAQTLSNFFA